jgi:glycosyltransferase involved in cell wall biosynthesis
LAYEKNLDAVVSAFESIKAAQPSAKLVFVGDGPAKAAMQASCTDVVFAGMRSGEALAEHYASGDVFLFPSLTETFGNVTLEAMACGLAVVAFDYAAAGQWIESNVNGRLVSIGDTAAFIKAAVDLASDLPAARVLGAQARSTALRLGWPEVVKQFEACLLEVLPGDFHSRPFDSASKTANANNAALPARDRFRRAF